ncbi:hypothetical protein HY485_03185 [Candidatus Woesearchaeota archaeon]|nr:hypothetical protein [Candidatus Woesearchaeota archaeon]
MTEQTQNETKRWEHNNPTDYSLQLSPQTILTVCIDSGCVYFDYHKPEYSEQVLYSRQKGSIKAVITRYKNTPQGKLGKVKTNAEPVCILENADIFSNVPGIHGKDKTLVDMVIGFVKEQF